MNHPILITGGTGALGRHLVPLLAARDVRVLSRRPGNGRLVGDLDTGAGLAVAARGARTIVHCASSLRGDDVARTRTLISAADAGAHLLYVSIVGVDRHPLRYYRAKYACERLIESCGLPHTILRATQFHEQIVRMLRVLTRLPVAPVLAGTGFQPIDSAEVAARLAELALGEPAGRAADLGGPEVQPFTGLARTFLRAYGLRRPVLPVRVPGPAGDAFRRGVHLAPDRRVGRRTFAEFLAGRPAARS
ncbi:SDR family oxidoreductase [Nonomuraea sp. NPDC000554]|uniref:SDR family oxidoreductase n=1 Tax=Nonomuraea sp. NPDC000554 TaxID=3154259 RepID=UPI0033221E1E